MHSTNRLHRLADAPAITSSDSLVATCGHLATVCLPTKSITLEILEKIEDFNLKNSQISRITVLELRYSNGNTRFTSSSLEHDHSNTIRQPSRLWSLQGEESLMLVVFLVNSWTVKEDELWRTQSSKFSERRRSSFIWRSQSVKLWLRWSLGIQVEDSRVWLICRWVRRKTLRRRDESEG